MPAPKVVIEHTRPSPFTGGYSRVADPTRRIEAVEAWMPGEEREISANLAEYLTSTFPTIFVEKK